MRTSTASRSTRTPRSRSCPGRRRRSASSHSCSRSAGRRSCCPTRTTRTTRPGPHSPGLRPDTCRSTARPAGRPTSPRRLATMSPRCSSTSRPTRARSACPRGRSPARSRTRRRRAPRSSTTSRTGTSSSTGARRRASSPSRARRRSASRCSRCRRRTGSPAGGLASSSATRRSWRGSTCSPTTRVSGSSRRCRSLESRR